MERASLESAAANFSYLRGWFYFPAGALCICAALANWEAGPFRSAWAFPVAVLVIGLACLPIARFYTTHYGRMSMSTRQQIRGAIAVLIGVGVMIGGSSLMRSEAGWSLDLPVNPIAVSFALIMLITYAIGVGIKAHHVIIWGTLLVVGAVPLWNGDDPSNIGLVLAGVAMMVTGVFDHRLFVDTFGPSRRVRLEDSGVGA
jgi:hypothetical protein